MFRKAQKSLSKARICLAGPAGAGKSYSALLLASGLGTKIAMIDTEHGSGDLYAEMLEKDTNGRSTIKKVGLQPVFRDGIEFEFMLFLDLAQDHTAFATKDRTTLFDGKYFKITRETGETIQRWLNSNNHKPVQSKAETSVTTDEQRHKGTDALPCVSTNAKPETRNSKCDNAEFLKCIEKMKGQVNPDAFKEMCKPYEPLDKLHDRGKQVELYNKLMYRRPAGASQLALT